MLALHGGTASQVSVIAIGEILFLFLLGFLLLCSLIGDLDVGFARPRHRKRFPLFSQRRPGSRGGVRAGHQDIHGRRRTSLVGGVVQRRLVDRLLLFFDF